MCVVYLPVIARAGTNGVRQHELSGLEKFEGIDPARWVPRDFAVVHVDSRGSGK